MISWFATLFEKASLLEGCKFLNRETVQPPSLPRRQLVAQRRLRWWLQLARIIPARTNPHCWQFGSSIPTAMSMSYTHAHQHGPVAWVVVV